MQNQEAGCLTCCISGMSLAWPSPFIVKITNDKENYNITEDQASYFTILNTVGLIVSLPFTQIFPDRIGRKPSLMLCAIPFSLCWILKLFFTNLYVLYTARFIGGFGDGFIFSSLPLYIGEVAVPRIRGIFGNGLIVFGYFGQLLMNIFGAYLNVQQTSLVCLIVPIIFVILFYLMPESPVYYIIKNKDEEAKDALKKLRLKVDIDEEFALLKSDIQRQLSESGTYKDLFSIQSNRRALIAGIFLRTSQMLSGVFVFVSYTEFIFEKSGGNINPSLSSIVYIGTAFILFALASAFAEKLGRKKSVGISLALTSVVLILEGLYFYIDTYVTDTDLSNIKWFPLAGMLSYIIFASFGIGIIPTLMLSELFSTKIKAKAITIVMVFYSLSYISLNMLFYRLTIVFGLCAPFFLFGVCNIISTVLVGLLVPETRGKTLEEIQQKLKS